MVILSKEHYIYSFDKEHEPAMTISSGEQVVIETHDCFLGQIESEETSYQAIDWNHINPATGPIYVKGAKPGDVLKVTIDELEIASTGIIATGKDLGVMGHRLEDFAIKKVDIVDNTYRFNEQLRLPINPMIGVIGVAPANEGISCGTPGEHGGNMDTTLITKGAVLYLPVFQEGALFGLGDLHAAMGDGEIGVSGIEVAGKVMVTLEVMEGKSIPHPIVVNEEGAAVIVSKPTLDEAAREAVEIFIDIMEPLTGLSAADLSMLFSVCGHVQVSQIVDPLMTARFFVPSEVFEAYGISLFK